MSNWAKTLSLCFYLPFDSVQSANLPSGPAADNTEVPKTTIDAAQYTDLLNMPRSHIELKCRTILPFNLQDVYRTALFQRMSTMRYTCFPRKDKNTHRYQALDININNQSNKRFDARFRAVSHSGSKYHRRRLRGKAKKFTSPSKLKGRRI